MQGFSNEKYSTVNELLTVLNRASYAFIVGIADLLFRCGVPLFLVLVPTLVGTGDGRDRGRDRSALEELQEDLALLSLKVGLRTLSAGRRPFFLPRWLCGGSLALLDELARALVERIGILAAALAPLAAELVEPQAVVFEFEVGSRRAEIAVKVFDERHEHVADHRPLNRLDLVMDEVEGRRVEKVQHLDRIFAGTILLRRDREAFETRTRAVAFRIEDHLKPVLDRWNGRVRSAEIEWLYGLNAVAEFPIAADNAVGCIAKAHFSLVHCLINPFLAATSVRSSA